MSRSSYVAVEDVVVVILSWLPVKSLVRFRCVCKSWYSLIKSSYFITKHLHRTRASMIDGNTSLFVSSLDSDREQIVSWIFDNEIVDLPLVNPESLPFFNSEKYSNILGPVNGIYCATSSLTFRSSNLYKNATVFLSNPALREVKAIPEIPQHHTIQEGDFCIQYGFGYDSKINDFKVVALTRGWYDSRPRSIFIYNLSTNLWRKLDAKFPGFAETDNAVFVSHENGIVYWFALDDQVFRKIQLPDTQKSCVKKGKQPLLFVSNESVFLIFLNRTSIENECYSWKNAYWYELWAMKEHGTKNSWTEVLKTGPLAGVVWPLGFWKNDEILLETSKARVKKLVSYNPNSKEFKDVHVLGHFVQVVSYMESLVSIK